MNRRDGGDGGRDLKRPRHGYDPNGRGRAPPRHYTRQGGFGGARGPPGYMEFDGPTHYLQGPDGPSVDGRTAFKRRLLGRLGWTCAAVPYFEWDPLLASGATEPYLRGVLARLR